MKKKLADATKKATPKQKASPKKKVTRKEKACTKEEAEEIDEDEDSECDLALGTDNCVPSPTGSSSSSSSGSGSNSTCSTTSSSEKPKSDAEAGAWPPRPELPKSNIRRWTKTKKLGFQPERDTHLSDQQDAASEQGDESKLESKKKVGKKAMTPKKEKEEKKNGIKSPLPVPTHRRRTKSYRHPAYVLQFCKSKASLNPILALELSCMQIDSQ